MRARTSTRRHNRRVRIDLNADVAESFGRWRLGDDAALLPHITSANVACGFHAGDARTIRETVERCAELGVVVGAQVSYRDLAGFGRRAMDVDPADLAADVLYQLAALDGLARVAGTGARYVKPHGALYHRLLDDDEQADAVVSAVAAWDAGASVLDAARGAGPAWQGGGADRRVRGLRRPRLPSRRPARAARVARGGAQRPRGRRPPGARPRRDRRVRVSVCARRHPRCADGGAGRAGGADGGRSRGGALRGCPVSVPGEGP